MMKKMIIVAAVLMLVAPAFGGWSRVTKDGDLNKTDLTVGDMVDWEKDGNTYQRKAEVWNWPSQYDYLPICSFPVQMEVGFWIKVNDCAKPLKLKQVNINTYRGSKTCMAYTNVGTDWKASFAKAQGIGTDGKNFGSDNVTPSVTPSSIAAAPTGKELEIGLNLTGVNLANLPIPTGTDRCLTIGTITLSVRPSVLPNSFMGGSCYTYKDANGDTQQQTWPTFPDNTN